MSRRQPARRSANRSTRRRKGVSGPTPAQLAAALVDAVAADLDDADPLQAQLVASYLIGDRVEQYWDDIATAQVEDPSDDGSSVPRPAFELVRLLGELRDERLRTPALALVLALASLDPDDETVQDAAVEVVKKLRFLGAKLPAWAEHVLEPELLGAWCLRDVYGDAMTIYVGTRHGGGSPAHCVAARIEQAGFLELVDVFVAEGPEVLVPSVEQSLAADGAATLLRFEELSLARAGQLLWDAIAGAEETFGEALEDDALDAFALLESRAMLLGPSLDTASDEERVQSPFRTELDECNQDELAERFASSDAYAGTDGTHADVAQVIADWATATIADGVARFSPNLALDLLGELAEAAEGDEERALLVEHGIATVRAWARFTTGALVLPDAALAEIERVLDDTTHEFERVVREGPSASTALTDRLMELMLEDGVDVGDQDELDAWSERWNALTDEQRIARMDTPS